MLTGDALPGSDRVEGVGVLPISLSHISHRTMLGWLMKVQTGQALASASATVGIAMVGLDDVTWILAGFGTPHSWHFSRSSVFWNEQMGQFHVPKALVGKLPELSEFADDGGNKGRVASRYIVIFADLLKNPAYERISG